MRIERLSEIAARFGGMLIDQFGVIHDGERLYPGTLEVMQELHRAGIPVAVITNSGKRASANRRRLLEMGLPRDHFVDVVSSGEVAYALLVTPGAKLPPVYVIGKNGEDYGFEGIESVRDPRDADLLLILGSNAPSTSLAQYKELLRRLDLPALCCNPDKLMLTRDGLQPAPGAIAALYEEMGGKVRWIGKPYPELYRHALALIGNPRSVLAIGDSAEHDVAGGRAAGLATLLVKTGVSAGLDRFEPKPDYLIDRFIW